MITAIIRPRLDDLGAAGHIHHTVLPAWFQEARLELLQHFRDQAAEQPFPLMIKEFTVTCLREIVLNPDLEITIGVEHIGNSSFILAETAKQGDHIVAQSRVVYVNVGPDNRPTAIPEQQKTYLTTLQASA